MKQSVSYIDTNKDLVSCCARLKMSKWLAVDTEFVRERTYFPLLCLIQIATEQEIFCVDVLEIEDLSPLYDILLDPSIIKVIHSAKQDLEAFYYSLGKVPQPIFDTQIAATFLGDKAQIGYAALVEKYTEVTLAKAHTRADWSKRPLAAALLDYAADDVRYLGFIYEKQTQALYEIERHIWAQEEFVALTQLHHYAPDPEAAWQRIKRIGHLDIPQLTLLQRLASWREKEAIEKDKPRKWIIKDDVLIDIACSTGQNNENTKINNLSDTLYRRINSECLMVAADTKMPTQNDINKTQSLTEKDISQVTSLQALVKAHAEKLKLSPQLLATRKDIELLVRGERQLPLLQGWRKTVIGESLLKCIQESVNCNRSESS
ncbi:Ribonuclease D [hydrothermal vent metagenome]|uniref:Ribonuclease D n=1 Tax=hydrothermal vent metagenome TaxID=652676 RepID=A0A3B0ZP44_9ZZZZ